jgi:hypothetical protein
MSSIVVAGDTSGSVTLSAPAVAGSTVLTLPSVSGTVLTSASSQVTGPAFSAYLSSNQSITNKTVTKVSFDTEEFDTNNNFASSRFTPTVAGYYQINCGIAASGFPVSIFYSTIYKNGSIYKYGNTIANTNAISTASSIVYLNGSTDYVEIYGSVTATSGSAFYGSSFTTFINGSLIRNA